MYNDPTGHFTEDAIKEYLKNTFGDAWEDAWNSWLIDEKWMNTLYEAQTGDSLSRVWYDPDGNAQIAHYTFEGVGDQELQGLSGVDSPDLYSVYRNSAGVGVVRPDEELSFDVIGKVGNIYYDINKISGFEAGLGETIIYGASFVLAGSFPPISSVAVAALDLGKIWYEKNRPETAFVGLSKGDVSLGISSFYATGEDGGILTMWRYGFRYNVSGIYQTEHKGTLQIFNPHRNH